MSVLKKMHKQWYRLNKDNIDVIKEKRDIEALLKVIKSIGKYYPIKPDKQ
jgi:hypothetical protein